ncbi:MAG: histidinol-phosphatase [Candidatus Zixiibacteriota bacterium]|nr:MAG: histidinol-phosphatase [candidate division Zixibacteria bacterium]
MSDADMLQPLPVEGLADYHCHCDYSVDAEGTLEEYCRAALKRNLAEICFTTHFDANPDARGSAEYICVKGERKPVSADSLVPYVDHVRRVGEKFYREGLSVKLGLEVGWFPGCESMVAKLKDRFDFDYLLCGIHELDDICFCCRHSYRECFQRYTAEKTVEKYFEYVWIAARSGLFDCIAHLNYYLRSGLDYYGESMSTLHRPFMEETFRLLVAGDTGLEINTSALRHGLRDYYPQIEVINAAKKAGVDVSRLGSDAHRPEQVGFDFEAALALATNSIRSCDG